jgi:hypothetical protein
MISDSYLDGFMYAIEVVVDEMYKNFNSQESSEILLLVRSIPSKYLFVRDWQATNEDDNRLQALLES